jgi:hypothetical protein
MPRAEVEAVDVATLKDKARGLEQQGKIAEALVIYRKILAHLEGSSGILRELPLYVKAGDLNLKLGDGKTAISMYERAAKRYATHGSGKSVITLCTRILRVDATRTYEYLGLARLMVEHGYLAEAGKVLSSYADRVKLDKAKEVLEQIADRPEGELRPVLELMLELAGRSEKERMKSAEPQSQAGLEEDDAESTKHDEQVEEEPAVPTVAPAQSQRQPDDEERSAADHASASIDGSDSRLAIQPDGSPERASSGQLAVDHSSASLDDSGSRPAIEPDSVLTEAGGDSLAVDHQSASLDDSGQSLAIEHGAPPAMDVPAGPVVEPSQEDSDDGKAHTLPWRIERQAEDEPQEETPSVEPARPAEVDPPRQQPMVPSRPRRPLTFTAQRPRKAKGARAGLVAFVVIIGGGAALWFADLLPLGRGGGGDDSSGTTVPVAGDTGSMTAAAPDSVGDLEQLANLDSLARIALDSVAPPAIDVTFDSLSDTTDPAVSPPAGVDTVESVPGDTGGQQTTVTQADPVVAVDGLAVQRVTPIQTGGYVVAQLLDSGEQLTLTVVPLGSDSADPTATGQVQVQIVGDSAVGTVLFGGHTVRASGLITPEEMERLLRRLVEGPPSVP